MELLETQDPEKKRLVEASDRHKKAMEKELGGLTEKTDKMLKNALIIGGSLALTFLLISSLSGRKKKRKKRKAMEATAQAGGSVVDEEEEEDETPSVIGQVGTQLLNQASLVLIDVARQKLNEYLAARKKEDEQHS